MFLLIYFAVRLTIVLISLFRGGNDSEWPQIEQAWDDAVSAMDAEGLDIGAIPIVVVTGTTPQSEAQLMQASGFHWKAIAPDPGEPSPIRVYGSHDGIFLCCTGASALSAQVDLARQSSPTPAAGSAVGSATPAARGTMMPGDIAAAAAPNAGPAVPSETPTPEATGGTLRSVVSVLRTLAPGALGALGSSRTAQAKSSREVRILYGFSRDSHRSQMRYIGELLRRDRPHCPLNGLLEIVPLDWSNYVSQSAELGTSAVIDREALAESSLISVPSVVAFSGCDELTGFNAFFERSQAMQPALAKSRAGVRMPGAAKLNPDASGFAASQLIDWFRGWTYAVYAQDLDGSRNTDIYRLLCELQDRRHGLDMILRGMYPSADREDHNSDGSRLFGVYTLAQGDTDDTQAFVTGVFAKLLQQQNDVIVPRRVILKDKRLRKIATAVFAVAASLLGIAVWQGWKIVVEGKGQTKSDVASDGYPVSGADTEALRILSAATRKGEV